VTDAAARPRRGRLGLALRVLVAALALWLLSRAVPVAEVARLVGALSPALLMGLFALSGVPIVVAAQRWRRLLAAQGTRLGLGWALRESLVGLGVGTLLPTSVGSDVVRAVRLARAMPASHATASVVVDRLAGLAALAMASCATLSLAPVPGIAKAVGVGLAVVGVVAWLALPRFVAALASVVRRPAWAHSAADKLAHGVRGALSAPRQRVEALGWSLAAHASGVAFVVATAAALGGAEHAVAVALGLPWVLLGSMLPLSFAGLGVREGLFVVVYVWLGVPRELAVALGLAWLASTLGYAGVGAVLYLLEARPPSSSSR